MSGPSCATDPQPVESVLPRLDIRSSLKVTTFSARPVEWRIPIGCDFSGFFVEVALGYIPVLQPRISELFLLQTRCSDSFLAQLSANESAAYLRVQVADHDRSSAETARSIAIEHGNPCLMRHFKQRPFHLIARLMSEGALPLDQIRCALTADELWVPTAWHRSLFEEQGIPSNKLTVVPEYVDTELFRPAAVVAAPSPSSGRGGHGIVFLSVYKWEQRKGWDVLLDAYWREFRRSERTVLRLRTYKPSWEAGPESIDEWLRLFARQRLGRRLSDLPRVEVLAERSRDALALEYQRADAFVLPSRGEGWCLPCVEAMASALPIIVTNYSGPATYLTDTNALPIRVAAIHPNRQAEPDKAHLRERMRYVVDERAHAAAIGEQARADVLERFSARRVGDLVVSRLEAVVSATERTATGTAEPRAGLAAHE